MSYRPRDIYRGRRKYKVTLLVILFLVAFLLLGTVGAFYGLQQFIVYDQNGVSLRFGGAEDDEAASGEPEQASAVAPTPDVSGMQVPIVYLDPDFSQLSLTPGEGLKSVGAAYVAFEDAADGVKLAARLAAIRDGDYSGVVMELKTGEGQLAWLSASALAVGYGTAGSMDYTETVAALHSEGYHVSARISCCADKLLAVRDWPIALLNAANQPYTDEAGQSWLDPYNGALRGYLIELLTELSAQGFDEVILDDLCHPVTQDTLVYSTTLRTEPNPTAAVCQLARRVAEAVADTGLEISVCLDADSLHSALAASSGQDLEIFWRIFDRVYCPSDASIAASDRETALSFGGSAERFVPICPYNIPEGFDSWVVQ